MSEQLKSAGDSICMQELREIQFVYKFKNSTLTANYRFAEYEEIDSVIRLNRTNL